MPAIPFYDSGDDASLDTDRPRLKSSQALKGSNPTSGVKPPAYSADDNNDDHGLHVISRGGHGEAYTFTIPIATYEGEAPLAGRSPPLPRAARTYYTTARSQRAIYKVDGEAYACTIPIATYEDDEAPLTEQSPLLARASRTTYATAQGQRNVYNVDLERNGFEAAPSISGSQSSTRMLLAEMTLSLLAPFMMLWAIANLTFLDSIATSFSPPDGPHGYHHIRHTLFPTFPALLLDLLRGTAVFGLLFVVWLGVPLLIGVPFRLAVRNASVAVGAAVGVATLMTQWRVWRVLNAESL